VVRNILTVIVNDKQEHITYDDFLYPVQKSVYPVRVHRCEYTKSDLLTEF